MIRALPVAVRPVDGETSESYFGRLAAANSIPTESLWGYLRQLHGSLPVKRNAEFATTELEALGGVPKLWFTINRSHHLLPIRCSHRRWQLRICDICSTTSSVRPGCRRCSAGQLTQVATATGAICLRHRRWIHNGVDLDLSHLPKHLTAEKRFRSHLTTRGIALGTGELELARRLLGDEQNHRSLSGNANPAGAEESFLQMYPQIVDLTIALTDPEFTALLMHPRWSPSQHALLLSRTICEFIGHAPSDSYTSVLWETVYQDQQAVEAAYAMMGTRSKRKCCSQRAFCAAAYTHRACLLRHLNAKHMPDRPPEIKARPAISVKATIRYQQAAAG